MLLVDDDCGVCCWVGLCLATLAPGLSVAPIRGELDDGLLARLPADRANASWHVYSGGCLTSAEKVPRRLLELAGHPRAARAIRLIEPVLGPAYSLAARHRALWASVVPRSSRRRAQKRVRSQVRRTASSDDGKRIDAY